MDALELILGLIVWVFAIIGALHVGKKWLGNAATRIASDPEGFKQRMGINESPSHPAHAHPSAGRPGAQHPAM